MIINVDHSSVRFCLNYTPIFMYFVHKLLVINLFDPRNASAAAKNDFYLNLKINI